MKIKKEKLIPMLGYGLFALGAFLVFFYRTFPLEALEKKVLKIVEAESGCRIKIAQRRLALPLGFSGGDLAASCPNQLLGGDKNGRFQLKVTRLELRLALLPLLFQRESKIAVQAKLGGGTLSGDLSIAQKEEGPILVLHTLEGKQVNLAETGLGLVGLVSLSGEGTWTERDFLKGSGQLRLSVENGRLSEIGGWRIPIGEVAFSKADAELSWQDGRIVFKQFSAQGELADVQGEQGNLLLRRPIDASLLTLSMRAIPKGNVKEMARLFVQNYDGRDALKIRVNGALRNPQLSVNGRAISLGT